MYYTWLLLIVTSCTAAQRCADSSNKNTYTRTTYRVSDEDFDSLITNSVVTTSCIHCATLCSYNRTNAYYESNTSRCRCQVGCPPYYPVSTGTNYVETYYISGKTLSTHSNMSSLSSFCRTSGFFSLGKQPLFVHSALTAPVIIMPGLGQEDGWIIIQRRVDASVSFYRSWDEYAAGFGDVDGNFWLGLDTIHDLTTAQPMSLQIDIVHCNLSSVSIPYQQFHVGDAASEYLLTITSDTPGHDTLYTSMNYHSGRKFSTYDNDNDARGSGSNSCAEQNRAGWWFYGCCKVCLNSIYGDVSGNYDYKMRMQYLDSNYYNLEPRTVTMKIKAIN